MQYLFIVIPGTIIGDKIYSWMKSKEDAKYFPSASNLYFVVLMFSFVFVNLVCLYNRFVIMNLAVNVLFIIFGYIIINKSTNNFTKFIKALFEQGSFWLMLGLFFEAFEGGIKKDHPTMSYYFLTTGLAIFVLIAFEIIIQHFRKRKYLSLLIASGQNPMIAYIAGSNLLMPLLVISGLNSLLNLLMIHSWLGFIKGLIFTILVGIITAIFTKWKIYWRT